MKKDSPETRAYHHGDLRRALIDSALSIVTEEQDWSFSLRELARRAGVSHAGYVSAPVTQADLSRMTSAATALSSIRARRQFGVR